MVDGVLPYLPGTNQIRTDWLVAGLPVCHVAVSIGRSCGRRQQSQLAALSLVADNRTAPGDAFTLEKARAPTFQTRVLWGGWVRTYVVAGAVSWAGSLVGSRVRLYLDTYCPEGTYLPSKGSVKQEWPLRATA